MLDKTTIPTRRADQTPRLSPSPSSAARRIAISSKTRPAGNSTLAEEGVMDVGLAEGLLQAAGRGLRCVLMRWEG